MENLCSPLPPDHCRPSSLQRKLVSSELVGGSPPGGLFWR